MQRLPAMVGQNHRLRARGACQAARGWRRTVTDSVSDDGAVRTGNSSAGMGVAAEKGKVVRPRDRRTCTLRPNQVGAGSSGTHPCPLRQLRG